MPTAGKLIAAFAFAALAYFVSDLVKPYLPEGAQVGLLSLLNALIGLIMGWRIVGTRAGSGYYAAAGYGLTAICAAFAWALLLWSLNEMLKRATRLYYDGVVDALQSMAEIAFTNAQLVVQPQVVVAALIGAVLSAWLAEYFAQRWS